jgi:hypothetical protein
MVLQPLHSSLLAVACRYILLLIYNSVVFIVVRLQTSSRFLNSLLFYVTKYTINLLTTTYHLNTLVKHMSKCPVVYKNVQIVQ